jgi:hypothetical protein
MDYGLYKGVPYWVILLDDTYCQWIYNRTSLSEKGRRFQKYLVAHYSQPGRE